LQPFLDEYDSVESFEAAFEILYRKYHVAITRYIAKLSISHEVAENIVHEVFIQAYEHLKAKPDSGIFTHTQGAYLLVKIIKRNLRNYVRYSHGRGSAATLSNFKYRLHSSVLALLLTQHIALRIRRRLYRTRRLLRKKSSLVMVMAGDEEDHYCFLAMWPRNSTLKKLAA